MSIITENKLNIDGSEIIKGFVAPERLGNGPYDDRKVLRMDQSWADQESSQVINDGIITPPIITLSQNNYNPNGIYNCNIIRLNASINIDITGIVAQIAGTTIKIFNVGNGDIKFKNNNILSIATNRFILQTDRVVQNDEAITIWYDYPSLRWRIASSDI